MPHRVIGLFGGTFDPIHLGHLNLALEMLENTPLDEVWFCPTFHNPLKVGQPCVAKPKERLEMVQLAIEGEPRFRCSDWEMNQGKEMYTVDVLRHLVKPPHAYHLIIGEDLVREFDRWKEPEEIQTLAPLLVGSRSRFEISSTHIRERLQKRLSCAYLLPHKVLDYISQNHLYFPN
ncbi:MAG: nicotinate (nicotinamide) nucleotide adenylyltransferase [Chlamydiia bacterium]|nr:nicotinate (nicotinamide) nucleotide adenylyltransferase [Chlamydiia bacterium]